MYTRSKLAKRPFNVQVVKPNSSRLKSGVKVVDACALPKLGSMRKLPSASKVWVVCCTSASQSSLTPYSKPMRPPR